MDKISKEDKQKQIEQMWADYEKINQPQPVQPLISEFSNELEYIDPALLRDSNRDFEPKKKKKVVKKPKTPERD